MDLGRPKIGTIPRDGEVFRAIAKECSKTSKWCPYCTLHVRVFRPGTWGPGNVYLSMNGGISSLSGVGIADFLSWCETLQT